MNNPLEFIKAINNPREFVINYAKQNNNPMINNLIQMAEKKDTKGLEHLYLTIRMKTSGWPLYVNPGQYLDKFMNMKRERICKKDPGYQAFKDKIEQQIKEEQKFYDKIMEKIS